MRIERPLRGKKRPNDGRFRPHEDLAHHNWRRREGLTQRLELADGARVLVVIGTGWRRLSSPLIVCGRVRMPLTLPMRMRMVAMGADR